MSVASVCFYFPLNDLVHCSITADNMTEKFKTLPLYCSYSSPGEVLIFNFCSIELLIRKAFYYKILIIFDILIFIENYKNFVPPHILLNLDIAAFVIPSLLFYFSFASSFICKSRYLITFSFHSTSTSENF